MDLDENLAFSTNADVAHYVRLRTAGLYDRAFGDYISGLGIRPGQVEGDFYVVRGIVNRG